ncbi:MAG: hypothetical protein ATN31_09570 [Candidatus Epulonipiscioides saccharophilum]|nr:MAG: hypothetical protein ATN31_09570 [Epulopiscium sp. AS2M-Bin001]
MSCYFKSVLQGFVPNDNIIEVIDSHSDKSDFLLSDIDDDDQPEIILLVNYDNKIHLTMLDRKNFKWHVCFFHEIDLVAEKLEFLRPIHLFENVNNIYPIKLEKLFEKSKLNFIAVIDNIKYEAIIKSPQFTFDHSNNSSDSFLCNCNPNKQDNQDKESLQKAQNRSLLKKAGPRLIKKFDTSANPSPQQSNNSVSLEEKNLSNLNSNQTISDSENIIEHKAKTLKNHSNTTENLNETILNYSKNTEVDENGNIISHPKNKSTDEIQSKIQINDNLDDKTKIVDSKENKVDVKPFTIFEAALQDNLLKSSDPQTTKIVRAKLGCGGIIIMPKLIKFEPNFKMHDYDVVIDEKELVGDSSYPTHLVQLVGRTVGIDPSLYNSLYLFVEDLTDKLASIKINLPISSGINPELDLVEFSLPAFPTPVNVENIIVKIREKRSEFEILNTFIYSFANNKVNINFDSNYFEYQFGGKLTILDDYIGILELRNGNVFELNLSHAKEDFLDLLYDDNGILNAIDMRNYIIMDDLTFVEDIDSNNLVITQSIISKLNNSKISIDATLGYVETTFRYTNKSELQLIDQYVRLAD